MDSASLYEPLDASKSTIRLLRFPIDQGISSNVIAYMEDWSLDSSEIPSFTTVSYTWGPPSYLSTIELQGRQFPVLDQLYPFLKLISSRHRSLPLDCCWWWIDSICINQTDQLERSQQVQLMRRVYKEASQTVVWLGEQSSDSVEAIKFLDCLCEYARSQQMTEKDVERLRGEEFKQKWNAVENLLQRSWWKRVWTLQEFIIPRSLTFCCGHQSFSRDALRDALVAIWICEHAGRTANVELLSYYSAWNRRRLYEWFVFKKKNAADKEKTALRLVAIMAYLGDCDATDPRDRIYSVLGLADDFKIVDQPDYKRNVEQVYTSLVTSFIRSYNSLDIICFAHLFHRQFTTTAADRALKLPSWVPDWSVQVRPEVVPLLVSQSGGNHISNFRPHHSLSSSDVYKASGDSLPLIKLSDDFSKLTCSGMLIDEIDGLGRLITGIESCTEHSVGDQFAHSTSPENFHRNHSLSNDTAVASDIGLSNVEISDIGLSDIELSDIELSDIELSDIEQAEIELSNIEIANTQPATVSDATATCFEKLVDAISESLVLGRTDKYLRNAHHSKGVCADFLAFCDAAQRDHEHLNPVFRQWYHHNKYLMIGGQTIEMLTTQPHTRNSASTPIDLRDGIEATSFLARFFNTTCTLERRLAVTSQGHIGMAPKRTRKHDLVCVLFGCSVPVVLRPRDNGESYEFVGEMYLHGFMHGEALEGSQKDKFKFRKFDLS